MIFESKVGEESISIIQQLANKTWKAAYSSIISPEQIKYMLDLFYSEASLLKQMQDGHQFIVAKEKDLAIGFASYSPKTVEESKIYRLHKLYVDPDKQGKGVGRLLTGYIINDIGFYNATALELNVNRNNKALYFYQKFGFKIIKEENIDIGHGYFMNDYVMELSL